MNSRVCLIRYPPKSNGYHLFPIAILGISHWQTHAMVILVLPGIIVARVIFQNLPFTAEAKKTRFEKTLHLSSPPKKSFHCDKSWDYPGVSGITTTQPSPTLGRPWSGTLIFVFHVQLGNLLNMLYRHSGAPSDVSWFMNPIDYT